MDTLATHVYPLGDSGNWVVKVKTGPGIGLEYHYSNERQARFMAAVLSLGPSKLPPAQKLVATAQPKKKKSKKSRRNASELANVSAEEIDDAVSVFAKHAA